MTSYRTQKLFNNKFFEYKYLKKETSLFKVLNNLFTSTFYIALYTYLN